MQTKTRKNSVLMDAQVVDAAGMYGSRSTAHGIATACVCGFRTFADYRVPLLLRIPLGYERKH